MLPLLQNDNLRRLIAPVLICAARVVIRPFWDWGSLSWALGYRCTTVTYILELFVLLF
jgi:hypothetical protein